jgi:predicted nucleic acid-binding protein
MKRIFLDSSVLFSAAYSSQGHSRDLILMVARGEVALVLSQFVLTETRRNLGEAAPEALAWVDLLLVALPFETVHPTKGDVLEAAEHVALKDAPIVAAAKKAGVDYLVTMDQKHLLGRPEFVDFAGVEIVTPNEAVAILRSIN